jgi:hypothetical protein
MSDDLDYEAALRRAGITVPPERDAIMRDAYRQMQALLAVLENPLAYEDEPAQLPRYDRGVKR